MSCLLIGPAPALFARGAPPMAQPMFIAEIDLSIVLEAPPPPRHEVVVERERPSRDHVWVNGYWINRRGHHEWVAGRWEVPPRGRTVWIEPRWEKRGRGYVFVEGYWTAVRPGDQRDRQDERRDDRH
jgi:hypothetical protein